MVQTCAETGFSADCLVSAGMTMVSAGRFVTAPIIARAPQSSVARSLVRADQVVNTAQAGVACTAAALGTVPFESCATNVMMAGLSVGKVRSVRRKVGQQLFLIHLSSAPLPLRMPWRLEMLRFLHRGYYF